MRLNDIRLDPIESNKKSQLHIHQLNRRMMTSSGPISTFSTKAVETQKYHETINKLKLLSLISSTLPPLSLEDITTNILKDVYQEYKRLQKKDQSELKEAYELFKESQYDRCIVALQRGYQASCLIEFLEREYSLEITTAKLKEKQIKKSLIQRLEEEREEMKQACQ